MTVCEGFDHETGGFSCRASATDRTPGGRLLCVTHMGEHWERMGERWNEDD